MIRVLTIALACMLFGCTQPAGPANSTSGESEDRVVGQSSVQDDKSQINVLQVAINSKDHSTLVAAVQAAELEDVLVNAGPLTVFAPTNAAFDALPEGTVADLLKPENKATLARIIKYHAAPGKYMGSLLKGGMKLYQASGHYIDVTADGDAILVGGARILGTVEASNGVVHVVDKVLLPPDNG